MKPLQRLPRPGAAFKMTVALWACVFVLYTIRSIWNEMPFWPQVFPRFLMCATGALICAGLYRFLRPHTHRSLPVQMALVLGSSIVAGMVDSFVSQVVADATMADIMPPRVHSWWRVVFVNGQAYLWVFLAWSSIYLAIASTERLRANELRLLEAQALAADAQNRMLRYQINPHFLFNTLNALSSLVLQKQTERAEQMLLALSGFLRHSLARSPDEAVPLREEVMAQEEYLRIEQARFGDRLRFVKRIDPAVDQTLVPSLILQPLIENAVKYAVAPSSRPVTVEVSACLVGDSVQVSVCDDGDGALSDSPSLGVGLENVRRRLEVVHGARASFSHGKAEGGGYCARITLPMVIR